MEEIDEFSGLLEGPRARGAFALRGLLASPWSLRVEADSPLTVIAMVRGECHIFHDNGECVVLGPGDVAITRAPGHYTITDGTATQPTVYIHPGQDCRAPDGRSLSEEMKLGVRTWGNDAGASTLMLIGSYESMADVSERLRGALPPLLWVKSEEWDSPLVQLLNDEMARDAPGQAAVLDRLLDMLLIAILRTWFGKKELQDAPWYQAKGDKVVGRTLKLIHQNPSHPWTLNSLSAKVGVSRAALARRFNEVVGEPPMAFLTQWRLALAADLLCEPDETVGTVAERVGYSSPFALSSAFKRVRGVSPQEHRARTLAAS
ncbi:transcriptional regulator, AraC family protein [Verrucomicrobiia bacterium DG1235]|nr:transcriptional regulator, AraC family protein [Verrucomicrobiae bacterium DG1235]